MNTPDLSSHPISSETHLGVELLNGEHRGVLQQEAWTIILAVIPSEPLHNPVSM